MGHVVPSHLMDRNLHPFTTLQTTGVADPAGDRAFDEMDDCGTGASAIIPLGMQNTLTRTGLTAGETPC